MKNLSLKILSLSLIISFIGCSSKPVYEKMSTTYIVHMDMRREPRPVQVTDESRLEQENTQLLEGLINKELKTQLAQ